MFKKPSGAQNRKRKLKQIQEDESAAKLMHGFLKKELSSPVLNDNEHKDNAEAENPESTSAKKAEQLESTSSEEAEPLETTSAEEAENLISTSAKKPEQLQSTSSEEAEQLESTSAEEEKQLESTSAETASCANQHLRERNTASTTVRVVNKLLVLQETIVNGDQSKQVFNYSDPALWPAIITNAIRDLIVEQGPISPQGPDSRFPVNNENRHFSTRYCQRILPNGEVSQRRWLLYSDSTDNVFCFCCKLFNNSCSSKLSTEGINNWKHMNEYLKSHETSAHHFNACKTWLLCTASIQKGFGIDKQLQDELQKKQNHWRAVLERLISITLFLSKNNLSFRGKSDKLLNNNNGNFLGLVELLGKYDPVLMEHISKVRNQEIHNHYCGKDIQNELIDLLGDQVKKNIIQRAKKAKYFSLICDCTPDVSHIEQLSVTIRFVDVEDMTIREHFLTYREAALSTGEALTNLILQEMERCDLDMTNCRGQGYDNGSNMIGKNKGVSTRISNLYPRAFFNPCGCHSINLIVGDAAKSSVKSVLLFGVIQRLYVLFSASPKRWTNLKEHVKDMTLKEVCETRWESRIDSVKAVRYQLKEILHALNDLSEEANDPKVSSEAKSLEIHMMEYSFLVTLIVWYDVLFQINIISKTMQLKDFDISLAISIIEGCSKFLTEYREKGFVNAQITAREICDELDIETIFKVNRARKKKALFSYEGKQNYVPENPEMLYKIEVFLPLVDTAILSVEDRFQQLTVHTNMWNFLYNIKVLPPHKDLMKHCMDLHAHLKVEESDINGIELCEELLQIQQCFASQKVTPNDVLQFILARNLEDIFPNLWISLRILLTIPVTVATGERSFSKLKLIKTFFRSTMTQERLNALAILSIENDVVKNIDLNDSIKLFARAKARKVHF